jgi:hypothetical protein
MLSEQVVGMAQNEWTASIGIDGRHDPDYAFGARFSGLEGNFHGFYASLSGSVPYVRLFRYAQKMAMSVLSDPLV